MRFFNLILLISLAFFSAKYGKSIVFLPPFLFFVSLSVLDLKYWEKKKRKYLLGMFLFSIIYISNFFWASFFEKIDDYINLEWANSISLMSFVSTPLVYFCYNYLTEKKVYRNIFILFTILGWVTPVLSNNIKIDTFEKIETFILLWQIIIGITLVAINQLNYYKLHSTHFTTKESDFGS